MNRLKLPYLEPTITQPGLDELGEMVMDGAVDATDGCQVEPDGWCQHGHVSWLIYNGWIG